MYLSVKGLDPSKAGHPTPASFPLFNPSMPWHRVIAVPATKQRTDRDSEAGSLPCLPCRELMKQEKLGYTSGILTRTHTLGTRSQHRHRIILNKSFIFIPTCSHLLHKLNLPNKWSNHNQPENGLCDNVFVPMLVWRLWCFSALWSKAGSRCTGEIKKGRKYIFTQLGHPYLADLMIGGGELFCIQSLADCLRFGGWLNER